ncbi:MAG: outer membrane beta-barrel protein [Rikenellaceae bacterium]
MRKLALLLLLVLGFTTVSKAQNGIYFAPKLAVGLSNYSGSFDTSFKGTFSGGLAVGLDMALLGVEASAIYNTAGATLEVNGEDCTINSRYISVPVVAKLFLINTLHIYAGPQFDFLVGERIKSSTGTITKSELLNDKTVSGVVGAGFVFPLGLGVAFNYNFGFSDVSAGSVISAAYDNLKDLKNQNMSLVFSYRF